MAFKWLRIFGKKEIAPVAAPAETVGPTIGEALIISQMLPTLAKLAAGYKMRNFESFHERPGYILIGEVKKR